MQQRQIKSLVEAGNYRPAPELVAQAMLQRRGIRTFLTGSLLDPAGRIQTAGTGDRRAA